MAAPMKIKTVRTDAFSMDYFRFGSGEEIFVILPGLSVQSVMLSADAIAGAYKLLADHYTVYVLDRRKEPPAGYSVYDMAADTVQALGELNISKATIFGASQGGMIAAVIAIGHPELVQNLILGSTAAKVTDRQFHTIEKWIQLAKAKKAADLYTSFGKVLYPEQTFEQLRGALIEAAKTVTDEDLNRFTVLAQALKGFDVAADLKKIVCPALIIGSDDDALLGADASKQIAERLDENMDHELYIYHGCGHAAYDTAADYKERILNFINQRGRK